MAHSIPPTIAELLADAAAVLAAAGIDAPRREARLLLAHAAGLDQSALLRDMHTALDTPSFPALVARRATREPLALITGRQGFWSLDLEVSADTLIPRADTETLVEAAIAARAGQQTTRILDLGTGTGALLLAVLTELPGSTGVGIDRAEGAARLARRNAIALGLAGRAAFLCGDWATAIDARFDLVLSNPPYIESAAIGGLMPEVAAFEPRRALDGGPGWVGRLPGDCGCPAGSCWRRVAWRCWSWVSARPQPLRRSRRRTGLHRLGCMTICPASRGLWCCSGTPGKYRLANRSAPASLQFRPRSAIG